jgi:hypothetical protein
VGFDTGGWYKKAAQLISSMQVLLPDRVKFENNMFATRDEFKEWLNANREVSHTHIPTHLHQNSWCGFAQVLIDPNM